MKNFNAVIAVFGVERSGLLECWGLRMPPEMLVVIICKQFSVGRDLRASRFCF